MQETQRQKVIFHTIRIVCVLFWHGWLCPSKPVARCRGLFLSKPWLQTPLNFLWPSKNQIISLIQVTWIRDTSSKIRIVHSVAHFTTNLLHHRSSVFPKPQILSPLSPEGTDRKPNFAKGWVLAVAINSNPQQTAAHLYVVTSGQCRRTSLALLYWSTRTAKRTFYLIYAIQCFRTNLREKTLKAQI